MTIDDLARVLEVFPTPVHIAVLRAAARLWPYDMFILPPENRKFSGDAIRESFTEIADFLESFIDEET